MDDKRQAPERRIFMCRVLAGSAVWLAARPDARAADHLDPNDPYAKAMGFRLNTQDVDQAKHPRHTVDQHCSVCQLWSGGDQPFGACSFFDGSLTPRNGWCKNFKAKK
jgi:hypothetical protein